MGNPWIENNRLVADQIKEDKDAARKNAALGKLIQLYVPEWGDRAQTMSLGEKEGLVEAMVMQQAQARQQLQNELLSEQIAAMKRQSGEAAETGKFWQGVGERMASGGGGLTPADLESWSEPTPGTEAMRGLGGGGGETAREGGGETARGGGGVGLDVLGAYLSEMKEHPSAAAAKELPNILHWATASQGKGGQWNLTPGSAIDFGGGIKGFATGPNSMYVEKMGTGAGQVTSEDVPDMPGYRLVTKGNGQSQLVKVAPKVKLYDWEQADKAEDFTKGLERAIKEDELTAEQVDLIYQRRRARLGAMGRPVSDEALMLDQVLHPEKYTGAGSKGPAAAPAAGGVQGLGRSDFEAWTKQRGR